ncbi:MAG: histidinol-phosphate transaminase [Paenibacillaceae bacterium]
MKPKAEIINLKAYQPGKPIEEVKRELGLTEITKLASNENPFGCSDQAKQAIVAEINNSSLYPDGASQELTAVVAEYHGVSSNQIIFGAGSDEVILMIARAYLIRGDETVMATHTFPQYKHNSEIEGAHSIEVPLVDGAHNLMGMLAAITPKTKIVWICNPNNPTGTMVTHLQVKAFLEQVSPDVLVVLDEAYCEYTTSPEFPDGLQLLLSHPNLILLRTFSKIYGLASLRIGFGIGHPEVIRMINQVREPFNTSRYAQVAAKAAIQDQQFVVTCREQNSMGLKYLNDQFTRLGLKAFPAHGNFIMVDTFKPADKVFQGLLERGFIVRGGHQLDFPTSIRVTIGSAEQNAKFINALEQTLQNITDDAN